MKQPPGAWTSNRTKICGTNIRAVVMRLPSWVTPFLRQRDWHKATRGEVAAWNAYWDLSESS